MSSPRVIVLDGYDGTGKTTLAQRLAVELGGRYVKSYRDTLGWLIWSLLADREHELAGLVARTACRKELEQNQDVGWLVFDRHWLTLFTLLPESCFEAWHPRPQTFNCTAELECVVERLHARGEKVDTPLAVHAEMLERFRTVAERFAVPRIDTTRRPIDDCLAEIRARL